MAVRQILALYVWVRILIGQQVTLSFAEGFVFLEVKRACSAERTGKQNQPGFCRA